MTWNGKIWAAPLNESNCVLFYNKDMFKAAGFTAPTKLADAWTMDQLLAAAIKLTKKDASGNVKVYGIMPQMFSIDNRNEGMTYTQMLWTWWFGGDVISPDGSTTKGYFDSPASLKALHFYQDLFQKYKVAPAMPMTNGFESERVAMWINGPWMVGEWKKNFPDFYKSKWGAMPLPRGAAAASNSGSWNLAMTAQSKNKKLAWQVIQAITGPEGSLIYCGKSGNLPSQEIGDREDGHVADPVHDHQRAARPDGPGPAHDAGLSRALRSGHGRVQRRRLRSGRGEDPTRTRWRRSNGL